ncbi:MAG: hypothetical protein ABEJ36_02965 [Candidatus Nanosalina sp.]
MVNKIVIGQLIFTGLLALFSYFQFRSMKRQREILEKDYQPDLELYLTGENRDSRPILCIHNNGGSSAIGVRADPRNKSDADTYEVEGEPINIPVIEPMQTVKIELPKMSGVKRSMIEDEETMHYYRREIKEGNLDKSDLDIEVQVKYRDARGEKEKFSKDFNLVDDKFTGDGIEFPTKDKERYVSGLQGVEEAIRSLGTVMNDIRSELRKD